ncbi:MAG TPA: NADH-quinone oxidoreductase subunit C, partial [Polyangiales bacterium]|nr:NADH-quinone oxidoreductase subunit C [Polyangiales bacterium]
MRLERIRRLEDPHELLTQPRLAAVVEEAPEGERRLKLPLARLDAAAELLIERHGRLVGLFCVEQPKPSVLVAIAFRGELVALRAPLEGAAEYPSLARFSAAALLMERELHDRYGIVPVGHPALTPVLHPDPDRITCAV